MALARTNLTLPEELMREVDELAGPRGRSAFVAEAVAARVKRERLRKATGRRRGHLRRHALPHDSRRDARLGASPAIRRDRRGVSGYLLDSTVIIDCAQRLPAGAGRRAAPLRRVVGPVHLRGGDLRGHCRAAVPRSSGSSRPCSTRWSTSPPIPTHPDGPASIAVVAHESGAKESLGDALIAGLAWRLDATVVTRNARDFRRLGVPVLEYGD